MSNLRVGDHAKFRALFGISLWLCLNDSLSLSNKRYEYGDKDKDEEGSSSKA